MRLFQAPFSKELSAQPTEDCPCSPYAQRAPVTAFPALIAHSPVYAPHGLDKG